MNLWLKTLLLAVVCFCISGEAAEKKKIVLIAGSSSHSPGDHEFRAGCLLLKKCLDDVRGINSVVYSNGWPHESDAFEGADAVFIYSDGGAGHPAIKPDRLKLINDLLEKGVGIGCAHYAVEVPKGEAGQAMLNWTGGYFETFWSVNPHWTAEFEEFPKHPITRGLKPFKANDEWYYHMRFRENMEGVIPILTATPPDSTRGKEGEVNEHGSNPHVQKRKGQPEHVMWAYERPDGGRGFGFTGGHRHNNWGNDNFRKVVLNAILWTAKAEVPKNGVDSTVTTEELEQNLDPKAPKATAAKPKPEPAGTSTTPGK